MIKSLGSYLFMATYNPAALGWFVEVVAGDSDGQPIHTAGCFGTREDAEAAGRNWINGR